MKRYLLIGALSLGGLLIATPLSTSEASESCTQSEQVLNNTVKKLSKKKPAKKAAPAKKATPAKKASPAKKATPAKKAPAKKPERKYEAPVEPEQEEIRVVTPVPASSYNSNSNTIFEAVEQSASFPGGQVELMRWISQHLRYPDDAVENNIQGRVVVKFVIEKDGSVSQVYVVRSVDPSLDAEAVRVVSQMPKWIPGKNNGEIVRSWFMLPVTFKLQAN